MSRILPRDIFKQLSEGTSVEPKPYENVTIYFSDIVGFTNLASEMNPLEVMIDNLGQFRKIIPQHNIKSLIFHYLSFYF